MSNFIKHYSMICAGEQNIGACYGDSGGPLIYHDENGQHIQIGIVSWGTEHCGSTTVFTKIAHPEIREFIRENSLSPDENLIK